MKIEAGPSTQSRRNTNLDALRAIAIFLVLGAHSGYRGLWEKPWARAGWAGVDLFFVLSGFLVSGLLFIAYKERGRIDCSHFYIRRGFKIWPAFYVLMVVGVLSDLVVRGRFVSAGLLPEIFFVQNYKIIIR